MNSLEKTVVQVLDVKLANNDVNLIDNVLEYLQVTCHLCKQKKFQSQCVNVVHTNGCAHIKKIKYRCCDCIFNTVSQRV